MKKNKEAYLIGQRTYLRLLKKADINKKYLSWLNDKEVMNFIETGIFPTSFEELQDYYKKRKKCRSH